MLQQILQDMFVEPEILAELSDEQKQLLFCKMREEQIRRWQEREREIICKEKQPPLKLSRPGMKGVKFLLGADNNPWVWVMGEHPDDILYERPLDEEEQASMEDLAALSIGPSLSVQPRNWSKPNNLSSDTQQQEDRQKLGINVQQGERAYSAEHLRVREQQLREQQESEQRQIAEQEQIKEEQQRKQQLLREQEQQQQLLREQEQQQQLLREQEQQQQLLREQEQHKERQIMEEQQLHEQLKERQQSRDQVLPGQQQQLRDEQTPLHQRKQTAKQQPECGTIDRKNNQDSCQLIKEQQSQNSHQCESDVTLTREESYREVKSKRPDQTRLAFLEKVSKFTQNTAEMKQLENDWQEQEAKAKLEEERRRSIARQAREDYKRNSVSVKGSRNARSMMSEVFRESVVLIGASLVSLDSTRSPRASPRPTSATEAESWYRDEERPKGAAIDVKTGIPYEWFHGAIARSHAEELLKDKKPHSFLVRLSDKIWGYAISYKAAEMCKHYLIDVTDFGYQLFGTNQVEHPTLLGLIQWHKSRPISTSGQELLMFPCGQADSASPDYANLFLDITENTRL